MDNKKILWFDIETAAETYDYDSYGKKEQREAKKLKQGVTQTFSKSYLDDCGIYPEFSKVVCISMMIDGKVASLVGGEEEILNKFNAILSKYPGYVFGGFNILGFDIPYLRKRMIINGIKPHEKLCIQHQKPWEVDLVDVMLMRKHTSFGCSLDVLSMTLLGESPKSEMSGANVTHCFYNENVQQIQKYCEGDVLFTVRCYEAIVNPGIIEKKPEPIPVVDTQAEVQPIDPADLFSNNVDDEKAKADCGLPF